MEKFLVVVLIIFLVSCQNGNVNITNNLLIRGVRAYNFHSNIDYTTAEKRFQEVLNRNTLAEDEEKAYAYMYLAKIKLKNNKIEEAITLLDESEKLSDNFPYKYEVLSDFFYEKRDVAMSKKYYTLLVSWLDNKINEIKSGSFNILNLTSTTSYSYASGQNLREYLDMYNPNLEKSKREELYLKYLLSRKIFAQKRLNEIKRL